MDETKPAAKFLVTAGDDSNGLGFESRGVILGAGNDGTLRFDDVLGNTHNFTGLITGVLYPFKMVKVHDTGTAATSVMVMR